MVKFKIDYNESNEKPELVFEYNTASTDLPEKMMRRFVELVQNTGTLRVNTSTEAKANGTTETRFFVEAIPSQ